MDKETAARLVDAIRQSLQTEPGQFHLEVNVSGQTISVQGGTGLVINAHGGGLGSTTVGQSITLDGTHIKIASRKGHQAMEQQVAALVQTLDDLATELRKAKPDRSLAERLVASLAGTWVPGVITSVLGNIITLVAL